VGVDVVDVVVVGVVLMEKRLVNVEVVHGGEPMLQRPKYKRS
jgi:hypothetical protein